MTPLTDIKILTDVKQQALNLGLQGHISYDPTLIDEDDGMSLAVGIDISRDSIANECSGLSESEAYVFILDALKEANPSLRLSWAGFNDDYLTLEVFDITHEVLDYSILEKMGQKFKLEIRMFDNGGFKLHSNSIGIQKGTEWTSQSYEGYEDAHKVYLQTLSHLVLSDRFSIVSSGYQVVLDPKSAWDEYLSQKAAD